jgi:hypothetical protein
MNIKDVKRTIALAAAVGMIALTGCKLAKNDPQETKRFATSDGLVELVVPEGWRQSVEKSPYDLKCVSRDERMSTNVFEFKREDLSAKSTPRATFQAQIADLQSKRENFVIVEPEKTTQHGSKTLTSVVYAGEKEESRYYYRFTLLESAKDSSVFAVILQVAIPSEWAESKPVLERITLSSRVGAPTKPSKLE